MTNNNEAATLMHSIFFEQPHRLVQEADNRILGMDRRAGNAIAEVGFLKRRIFDVREERYRLKDEVSIRAGLEMLFRTELVLISRFVAQGRQACQQYVELRNACAARTEMRVQLCRSPAERIRNFYLELKEAEAFNEIDRQLLPLLDLVDEMRDETAWSHSQLSFWRDALTFPPDSDFWTLVEAGDDDLVSHLEHASRVMSRSEPPLRTLVEALRHGAATSRERASS